MFSASKSGQYPGYLISRSVRLRSSASAYFNRTPASATNRQTWTWSAWVKRGQLGVTQLLFTAGTGGSDRTVLYFGTGNLLEFYTVATTQVGLYQTSAVFRDPSAWYHIVCSVDTTNATAANRLILYINGVQQTLTTTTTIAQNSNLYVNSNVAHAIGREAYTAANYLDGYLTEINFIDGQALTPSSFGAYNAYGVWSPMKYNGTYGTNGFYLNFSDNSGATATTIGKDSSGNGNNWTPNNISVTAGATYDSMLDVPTPWPDGGNGRGNYAVLNPLDNNLAIASITNGNLQHTGASAVARYSRSTIQIESGKYYWEITATTTVAQRAAQLSYGGTYSQYISTGVIEINGSSVGSGYATWAANDVIGVALDRDNNTVSFYKNNTLIYTGTSLNAGAVIPQMYTGSTDVLIMNFGQRPFAYTPPSGFRALNTLNLPEPTIKKGNQYFDATLWTGNGGTMSVTNAGSFQPDLLWIKSRSLNAWHSIVDSSRGRANVLASNSTQAEVASPANTDIVSLNADGFTVGPNQNWNVTNSGATFVGWQWKEGATQGFDIVTFTATGNGQTINHSLGVAPKMIIYKPRNAAIGWTVMHDSLANMTNRTLELNTTSAVLTMANAVSAPTSTTFGCSASVANNTNTMVAYLFAEVAGFSRFGSYTGNGSTDGPFVFLGFRPRWVMMKRTDVVSDWWIFDTERAPFNQMDKTLYPNLSNAEFTGTLLEDFLSNGFKIRSTSAPWNASGGTYIFAAFAENPTKYALAR